METKICSKCGKELPATEEYFHHKRCECKECIKNKRKEYYELNSDKIKKKMRTKYSEEHPNMGNIGGKIDMINKKYGRMLVLEEAPKKCNQLYYLCLCDCGSKNIVNGNDLRMGKIISCGCYHKERGKKWCLSKNGPSKSKSARTKISIKAKERLSNPKNHPMYGHIGDKSPMYGRIGDKSPMYGRRGKDHPSWKGGLTKEERNEKRMYFEYREWRKSVYERDNYTCQKCGKRGGVLHAHHIKNFKSNIELRTTLSNGITLCKKCHKNFHHTYGTYNNNEEQIKCFLVN